MSEDWSSQNGDDLDDIDAWMARRNAQAALQPQADAFARRLWNQASQNGHDLYAGNPSDLTAIGLAALGGAGSYLPIAANDDGQDGGESSLDPSSSMTRARAVQDGAEEPAAGGDLYLSNANTPGSQGSPNMGSQSLRADPSRLGDENSPWVSELDVVGRPVGPPPHTSFLDDLNHSLPARIAGGLVGYGPGLVAGVGRAGLHALEGVGHGLNFTGSLFFPKGRAEAWSETTAATHNALQYGRSVLADPSRLAHDASSAGTAAVHSLIPFTTMADTGTGEIGHEAEIGMNGGELAANVAGFLAAPEVLAGVNAARGFAATQEANVAKFMAQGLDEPTAGYLSKPYKGEGEHAVIPQAQDRILGIKTPWLENATIPDWIMDSPLNVSKPRGLSQGDFYEYHYAVDPEFDGARLPRYLNGGKGWSGAGLGAERYSGAGQLWARTPPIWKDYVATATVGDGLDSLAKDRPGTPQ